MDDWEVKYREKQEAEIPEGNYQIGIDEHPIWTGKQGYITYLVELKKLGRTHKTIDMLVKVENTIADMVSNFLYYHRQEDEDLPLNSIQEAIKDGILSEEQIVKIFETQLKKGLS
jgi:hypothetical protein